jgi:hypothetical protein
MLRRRFDHRVGREKILVHRAHVDVPAFALALVGLFALTFAGCEVAALDYVPDPGIHAAGWKCPDPD